MAIITPPARLPLRRVQWRRTRVQQHNRSDWTGSTQVVRLPGATRWSVSGEFAPMVTQAAARRWIAFFEALDGMVNSFPVVAVEAAQTVQTNPVVNGAGQTGASLNLTGCSGAIGSELLPAGAKISIPLPDGSVQLEVLTAPIIVTAGGGGVATFSGWLRRSPAAAATVEIAQPSTLMRLTTAVTGWDVDAGQMYGFQFEAEEAF